MTRSTYPNSCPACGVMSYTLCLCAAPDEQPNPTISRPVSEPTATTDDPTDFATFGECPVLDVAVLGGGERRAFASVGMVSDEDGECEQ